LPYGTPLNFLDQTFTVIKSIWLLVIKLCLVIVYMLPIWIIWPLSYLLPWTMNTLSNSCSQFPPAYKILHDPGHCILMMSKPTWKIFKIIQLTVHNLTRYFKDAHQLFGPKEYQVQSNRVKKCGWTPSSIVQVDKWVIKINMVK